MKNSVNPDRSLQIWSGLIWIYYFTLFSVKREVNRESKDLLVCLEEIYSIPDTSYLRASNRNFSVS